MAERDLIDLYSKRILALAADIPHVGRLDAPMGTARVRAPLCGSVVTVDLDMDDNKISRFSQDVKACALGQAAAAVIGEHVLGRSRADIAKARTELLALLKSDGPVPSAPFGELAVLRAAQGFTNRHASILLALEAVCEAMAAAQAAA